MSHLEKNLKKYTGYLEKSFGLKLCQLIRGRLVDYLINFWMIVG